MDTKLGTLGLVFVGGGIGSVLRYVVGATVPASPSWPAGTVLVNLAGCLLLGLLVGWFDEPDSAVRKGLGAGVLGGFTTFSTFAQESRDQLAKGETLSALLSIGLQVGGGILLSAAGFAIARRLRV